jgi:diguanylate cyclase (GGDEF)-like protein
MADGPTIGVLSPFIGGVYYGAILAGITRAATLAGSKVVAVQTLDAGAYMTVSLGSPSFVQPVAWDRVDGFLVLPDAIDDAYLGRLHDAGKPMVLVGHEVPGCGGLSVLADNGRGVRDAVTHLIEHGHRHIGFTGFVTATDIAERYQAYRETLLEHGITPDPDLFFEAADNLECGIAPVRAALLARGRRATAMVAGTDRNAIAIIQTLESAGRRVPHDFAVVGFDDLDIAPFLTPSLASVRQMLDNMGGTAVDLLHRQIDGDAMPLTQYRVPTAFVPRRSCGCTDAGPVVASGAQADAESRLGGRLATLLPPPGLRRAEDIAALRAATAAIASAVGAATHGEPVREESLSAALAGLYAVRPQPESLAIVGRAAEDFARETSGADVAAAQRGAACVHGLILELARLHGRSQFADNRHLRATVSTQYELSLQLLHTRDVDPRGLDWLAHTPASAGYLGLWNGAGELAIGHGWRRSGGPAQSPGTSSVRLFPPAALLDAAGPDEAVFVVPAKVNASDWGMLAIAGPVESRLQDGKEIMNQSAALLTVALDLRDQQSRLRQAALSDGLTGLPNRTAFLDTLDTAVARTRDADGYRFAVLFLDLDGFKYVNDTLGHAAGDRLLVHVADRIRANLRPADSAARFGGDEFLVLVDGITGDSEVHAIADRLHAAIVAPYDLGGTPATVGVSIGVTFGDLREGGGDPCSADEILLDADTAMYRAKAHRKAAIR